MVQVVAEAERRAAAAARAAAANKPADKAALEAPATLEENINRVQTEGEEARTVEEAIAVLRWESAACPPGSKRRRCDPSDQSFFYIGRLLCFVVVCWK